MNVEPPVLILRAAHVHHVGVARVVGRVGAEIHQDHAAHRQDDSPLVIWCRVGQDSPDVSSVQNQGQTH